MSDLPEIRWKPIPKAQMDNTISLYEWSIVYEWFKDFENECIRISFVDIEDDKIECTITPLMIDFIKPIIIIFITKIKENKLIPYINKWCTYMRDLNTAEIMNLKSEFVREASMIINCSFYERNK